MVSFMFLASNVGKEFSDMGNNQEEKEVDEQTHIYFAVYDKITGVQLYQNAWSGKHIDCLVQVNDEVVSTKHVKRELCDKMKEKNERSMLIISWIFTMIFIICTVFTLFLQLRGFYKVENRELEDIVKGIFLVFAILTYIAKRIYDRYLDEIIM